MSLTAVQIVRVAALRHHGDAVGTDERLQLIADAESAEELHRIVLDAPPSMSDVVRLSAIIKHPHCAQGTAFLIYWALQPATYYWILKKRKPFTKHSEEVWALLMAIEERVRARRHSGAAIEFSLPKFFGRSLEEEARLNPGIWSVPDFMRSDVGGSRIE